MKEEIFTPPAGPTLSPGWSIVSADKLCANPPQTPAELIHGLLYEGGTLMLSGPSKGHKTYTMLAAGHAIATGGEWLGFKTTARPVLYLNLELQDLAVAHRLASITTSLQQAPASGLHMVNLRGCMVSLTGFQANLGAMIEHTKARLVIVDPHYKMTSASGIEENSNDDQAKFLYEVETACAKNGAACMIAHHFAKGDSSNKKSIDRAAGGGAIARWADVVMTLTEHEEPDCMTAEFSLRNFAPVAPFVVRWMHPVWTRDDSMNPAMLKKAGRSDQHPASELLEKLENGMSNAEWRKAANWPESTFRRKRDELTTARRIRLTSGCYYHVPPQSPQSPQSILAA